MSQRFMNSMRHSYCRFMLNLLVIAAFLICGISLADTHEVSDEQRFRALTAELRCLVCQNQSLADSDAGLAEDMRREIRGMIARGSSDQEIVEFLVARYGDFVRYRPPVKPATAALWFGPLALFLIAIATVVWMLKRRRRVLSAPLSADEQTRLHALLHNNPQDKNS